MNILMTADTIGGVWTYAMDLIHSLDAAEHKVTLATMGQPLTDTQRTECAALPHLNVRESCYRLEWMNDPWADVDKAGHWLMHLARETRPDVVHLNGYAHAALPWHVPVLVVAHSCVASWWSAVKAEAMPPAYARYGHRVREGLRTADMVVAPTNAMLTALLAEHGPVTNSTVIPNGRDPARFAPASRKEPYILGIGRLWDEAKNVGTLDRAAANLPWPVRLAGCEHHPSGSRLTLNSAEPIGVLSPAEVARQLSRASIFASPARYEPFGLAVLEAALSGCALVLGDIPSFRENWQDAALFVKPDDTQGLRDALLFLIEDTRLRIRLGYAARRRAQHFSLNAMGAAYAQLYRRLCSPTAVPVAPVRAARAALAEGTL